MSRTVSQNGKSVVVSTLKGVENFAAGYRIDTRRPLTALPPVGSLIVRIRANARTLIKVTAHEGANFKGQYTDANGVPVKETPARVFEFAKWPVYMARKSH